MADNPITPKVRKHRTPAQRRRIVEQFRHSGLTRREFVHRAGISLSALQLWLKRSNSSGSLVSPTRAFLPVPNLLGGSAGVRCYRVRLGERICVEIPMGFSSQDLNELLRAAAQL